MKEPLDGGIAQTAVAVVDDEEAIAELGCFAAVLVRLELGVGSHLLRRMRAGVGRMQGLGPRRRWKLHACQLADSCFGAGEILYWRHNE